MTNLKNTYKFPFYINQKIYCLNLNRSISQFMKKKQTKKKDLFYANCLWKNKKFMEK